MLYITAVCFEHEHELVIAELQLVCFYVCYWCFVIPLTLILTVYGESDVVLDSQVWQERVESQAGDGGVVVLAPRLVLYHRRVTKLEQFLVRT